MADFFPLYLFFTSARTSFFYLLLIEVKESDFPPVQEFIVTS